MTAPAVESVLTLQELRDHAALLERSALHGRAVTEAAIDARRPGCPEYPGTAPSDWLVYVSWLARQLGGGAADARTRSLAQVKLDAAGDTPVLVRLACGETIAVQPKSARALLYMRALDAEARQIGPEIAAVLDGDAPAPEAVHAAVWGAVLQSKSLQLWLWVAIDGIDLPFDERAEDPVPPPVVQRIRARDLLPIMEAHYTVNQLDLELLVQHFPTRGESRGDRSFADVLGAIASERGVPTPTLFTGVTVRGLYHQALASAQVAEDARQRHDRARGRA